MSFTRLKPSSAQFPSMMNGFGVVTVMDADIYDIIDDNYFKEAHTPEEVLTALKTGEKFAHLATIDSLKVANVTVEGPNKTVMGGQYSNPLIKYGKKARLEMQDALGRADAIEAFGGAINVYEEKFNTVQSMHVGDMFAGERLIVGKSFFIDKATGQQVKVKILFYRVLPDSIFNLTQDAEGDATVFDMNADLLTTKITLPSDQGDKPTVEQGVFYSILEDDEDAVEQVTIKVTNKKQGAIAATITPTIEGAKTSYSVDDGGTWTESSNLTSDLSREKAPTGTLVSLRVVNKGRTLATTGFIVE